jgi:hypothetical protein
MHHPLFESLALPLLLSLAAIGLFRRLAGPRHAAVGFGLAVLLATLWMVGWTVRPAGVMQKLPWIFAGAWLLGAALDAGKADRRLQWLGLLCGWIAACWWLGTRGTLPGISYGVAGAWVLACLLRTPEDRSDAAAAAVVAALGLAGVCFVAGSLALFQLAVLLAAAVSGLALWLWPKPRVSFGATGVAVAGLAWLALAQATLLLVPARPPALALLAASFVTAPLLAQLWPASRPRSRPLAVALLTGILAAGALALQGVQGSNGAPIEPGIDDGYYRP